MTRHEAASSGRYSKPSISQSCCVASVRAKDCKHAVSGFRNRIATVITNIRGLITPLTPLIAAHEPPSRVLRLRAHSLHKGLGFRVCQVLGFVVIAMAAGCRL